MTSTPDSDAPVDVPAEDVHGVPEDVTSDPVAPEGVADVASSEDVDAGDAAEYAVDETDEPAVEESSVDAPAPAARVADERLLAAHDLALAALHEITPAPTVGDAAGYTLEDDGVVSLRFANLLSGYPGWFWTVSLARVEDEDPTVLEVELLPGDDALLAPEWVPWAVRLAEYQAQQAVLEAERAAAGEAEDDVDDLDVDGADDEDIDDLDDLESADFDEDGSPILHSGDVDGVDIDLVDEEDSDDEDSDDEDSGDEPDDDEGDSEEDGRADSDDAPEDESDVHPAR